MRGTQLPRLQCRPPGNSAVLLPKVTVRFCYSSTKADMWQAFGHSLCSLPLQTDHTQLQDELHRRVKNNGVIDCGFAQDAAEHGLF